jgi:hypothetical protein
MSDFNIILLLIIIPITLIFGGIFLFINKIIRKKNL